MAHTISSVLTIIAFFVCSVGIAVLRTRLAATTAALNALRSNCFVTSERGHRIRYVNASPEVRARAETAD